MHIKIMNLMQVITRHRKGDTRGAKEASNIARKFSLLTLLFLLVTVILLILGAVLFAIFYGIDYARGIQISHKPN